MLELDRSPSSAPSRPTEHVSEDAVLLHQPDHVLDGRLGSHQITSGVMIWLAGLLSRSVSAEMSGSTV